MEDNEGSSSKQGGMLMLYGIRWRLIKAPPQFSNDLCSVLCLKTLECISLDAVSKYLLWRFCYSFNLENIGHLNAFENIADNKDVMVAGSVGPYGACQGDGSEYSGLYCESMSQEELMGEKRFKKNVY